MKHVKRLQDENGKNIKFTHYLDTVVGFTKNEFIRQPDSSSPTQSEVYYLGHCIDHGDMFMDTDGAGRICIFKGHLNSGTY